MEIDDLEQAAAYAAQLLPLTRRYCRHELANVLLWSVEIDRKLGNPKNVHRWLDEVIEVSRERRSPDREAAALQELSRLAEGRGDLEGAEAYLMRACRIFESRDSSRPLVDLLVRRAELALVANLPGKAHNLLDLALGIAEAEQVEWRHQDLARIEKLQAALQNRTAGAE
jgi:hypothetical protein